MTCTKTEPKNDLFFNCRTKTKELSKKELSKKELSNVAPALSKFPMQDDWVRLLIGKARNVCKSRSAAKIARLIQKRVEF